MYKSMNSHEFGYHNNSQFQTRKQRQFWGMSFWVPTRRAKHCWTYPLVNVDISTGKITVSTGKTLYKWMAIFSIAMVNYRRVPGMCFLNLVDIMLELRWVQPRGPWGNVLFDSRLTCLTILAAKSRQETLTTHIIWYTCYI